MRTLAALIDSSKNNTIHNLFLVQTIASQALALAAYKQYQFQEMFEIERAVSDICGYPIHNQTEGSMSQESTVEIEAVRRVADIVGIKWRDG